tara:strand:+ start:23 stop:304 length:282 start_codon:yes stop_codon:yes gene_type:complete
MNIVEQYLIDGTAVAFSVPLYAKHLIISSNSSVGFFLTLFDGDGYGKRFQFPAQANLPLDIKGWCADSTQFFITGNTGTPPNMETVSVLILDD